MYNPKEPGDRDRIHGIYEACEAEDGLWIVKKEARRIRIVGRDPWTACRAAKLLHEDDERAEHRAANRRALMTGRYDKLKPPFRF